MLFKENGSPIRIIGIYQIHRKYCKKVTKRRNFHVLSYRLHGESDFQQGTQMVHVVPGDLLHIPANIEYRQCSQGERLIALHLEIPDAKDDQLEVFNGGNPSLYDEWLLRMYQEWTTHTPGAWFSCHAMLYEILAATVRQQVYRTAHLNTQNRVQQSLQYVDSHFMDPQLTVADLAEQAGISEVYFRKLFHKEAGKSPARYIAQRRLQYAKEMLLSGYFSVSKVAEEAGFSDAKYFSTVFRKEFGVAPSQFRSDSSDWETRAVDKIGEQDG